MSPKARELAGRIRNRLVSPATPHDSRRSAADRELRSRVDMLEREVQELRQLNRRLADALDVMTELLVPAMDRDDARVKEALGRLKDSD